MKDKSIIVLILIIVFIIFAQIYISKDDDVMPQEYSQDIMLSSEYNSFTNENLLSNVSVSILDNYDEEFKDTNNGRFYYSFLTDAQKDIYNRIVDSCLKFESSARLNKNDMMDVYFAQNAVSFDYPEIFWTDSFTIATINNKVNEIRFEVPSDVSYKLEQVDSIATQVLSNLPEGQVAQLKYIYDWIVQNTEYENSTNAQNITSVFIDKKSVCAGYSRAFQYLCQKAGFECTYVGGFTKNNEPHAWNLIKLNDNYYWIDTTWGDPVFAGMKDNKTNYNYFLVSDELFLDNHIIDDKVRMQDGTTYDLKAEYPKCIDSSLFYYNVNNCYFTSYDKQEIDNYLLSKFNANIFNDIEFKFKNVDDFNTFFDDFFSGENAHIFDIIKNVALYGQKIQVSYSYIESANYLNLTVIIE